MEAIKFTAKEIDVLAAEAGAAPQDVRNVFCDGWPVAKKVLEALRDMTTNPFAKAAISTIVTVGDAVHGRICQ